MHFVKAFPTRVLAGALVSSAALLCVSALQSQSFTPQQRITGKIDESKLVALRGNTPPAASALNDRGRVSPDLPMTGMVLVLSRDTAQQAAFEQFVASQYDPNSPNYHQWLTPEQVGENFGPSNADIATVSHWLTSQGFSVDEVSKNRLSIRFSGNASQVESAFHTEIHNLTVNGKRHIGNMNDPEIPAALSPVVLGVKALHNFFPRPAHHMGGAVTKDSATGHWMRLPGAQTTTADQSGVAASSSLNLAAKSSAVRPQFGISVGGSDPYLVEDVAPGDFATIYNILPLWNGSTNAGVVDGTGQTIAIAGTSDIDVGQSASSETGANGNNDVATFRTFFGLPTTNAANTPKRVSGNSQPLTVCTDPGTETYPPPCTVDDLVENSLDVEWSGAVAKNAQIVLVSSYVPSSNSTDDGLFDSESYIVDNIANASSPVYGARIMNVSYGECELANGTAGNVEYYNLWQTAAAEGIAVFVAAGDSGSASCDQGSYLADSGLTVSGLASTPWNTAVGGTDFNWCSLMTLWNGGNGGVCTASPYWNASNSAAESSVNTSGPQAGYIPETPWNESCANPLTLPLVQSAANVIYGRPTSDITTTEQSCNFIVDYFTSLKKNDSYFSGLLAAVGGSGGASGCVVNSTSSTSNKLGSCSTGATNTGSVTIPGGATVASIALLNDGWTKPSWQTGVTGIPNDGVRDLPDVSFFAADGYISSSAYLMCASAVDSKNAPCSYSSKGEPYYQEVGGTSVATPAMAGVMALINQKAGAPQGSPNSELYALAAKQTWANCKSESVTPSSQCYFNDIDSGTNAMPCDYGAYSNDYYLSPNCTVASLGTFGYADVVGILPGYSGGAGYDRATGLGSLNVANVVNAWSSTIGTGATTVTVTPPSTPVSAGQSASVAVTVVSSPTGGATPTGSVTLSGGGYTSTPETLSSGAYTFTIPAGSLTGGTDTLSVSYTGDAKYAPNTGSASVTVSKLSAAFSSFSFNPSNTIQSNQALVITGTVDCSGSCAGAATPTGTVTISYGTTYTSLPATLSSGNYSVTITPNSLTGPSGADTLTVQYSGDTNYDPANTTTQVNVTYFQVLTPAVAVTSAATVVNSGVPLLVTVTVSGSGATPTGTLTLAGSGLAVTQGTLSNGVATFNIPANTLNSIPNFASSDTLTADYLGDADYAQAVNTLTLTVTQSNYSLAATTPAAVSAGSSATSSVSVASSNDYTGAVTFTSASCVLTGYPAGVTASTAGNPTCALTGSGAVTMTGGVPSGAVTYSVSTTGSTTAQLSPAGNPALLAQSRNRSGWFETAGGSALAALFLFLAPFGSRKARKLLCALFVMAAATFTAVGCGGGGSSSVTTLLTPTVTVKPASSSILVNSPLNVTVAVAAPAGSSGTPTGGVDLSGGGYSSSSKTLSSGSTTFAIPANSFTTIGSVTLTANYGGDSSFNSASGTATITVSNAPTTPGSYTFTVTPTASPAITPAVSTTFTVTVN